MSKATLWRIDGVTGDEQIDTAKLTAGLQLHLQHAPLQTTLVQIGEYQRAYVALTGCGGCEAGVCRPGCYVTLFRRMLHATAPSLALAPVPRGLRPHPYTTILAYWPRVEALALDGALLAAWPEARLTLHWGRSRTGHQTVAGLLAVAEADTDPFPLLKDAGWRPIALAPMLRPLGRWLLRDATRPLLWPRPTAVSPTLLLPAHQLNRPINEDRP
jgi:hypothetical protein